ncbi:unnamed protein product [Diatraea saccharalis]|uniref:Uncharacterized protein n=1 Tax=Diatraea saccharalis TaxID=40085 RepID=A0A9N9WAC8_9NEOP|nr:unnamed protein product [Diatraea saccharalis]
MFAWSRIVEIVLLGALYGIIPAVANKITNCEEFELGARFNPYEIMDSMWKIFYSWANTTEITPIIFSLPAKNRVNRLKILVETVDPTLDLEWHKITLIMQPRKGLTVLFLYATTPGAFRAVVILERYTKGMMCCEDLTAYALARIDEIPTTEEDCLSAAAKFNIDLPDGHSYLYVHKLADEL